MTDSRSPGNDGNEFEQSAKLSRTGFLRELSQFLKSTKKWWLAPIIVIFLLLGVMMLLASTGAAPFIYTIF